jgi:hypothetical protein
MIDVLLKYFSIHCIAYSYTQSISFSICVEGMIVCIDAEYGKLNDSLVDSEIDWQIGQFCRALIRSKPLLFHSNSAFLGFNVSHAIAGPGMVV